MRLAINQEYGTLTIDFYLNKQREIFVTIDQLAKGFGYKSRKGIERMIERQPYLRNKKYSVLEKVPHRLGGPQETRLFNKRGIMEIGMLSQTKQGKEFRNWIFDHIEELEEENRYYKEQRSLEAVIHRELEEAIKNWSHKNPHSYIHINNLLLKSVTGMNANQLKEARGQASSAISLLSGEELKHYRPNALIVLTLIELETPYQEIKHYLEHKKALALSPTKGMLEPTEKVLI